MLSGGENSYLRSILGSVVFRSICASAPHDSHLERIGIEIVGPHLQAWVSRRVLGARQSQYVLGEKKQMKTVLFIATTAGCLLASSAALADDYAALAKKSGCFNCHAVDKKVVGPSYKDVAKKYKDDAAAVAKLVKKVADGGSGVWGPVPMPPNKGKVSEADIKTLVEWVLSQQ